MKTLAERKAAMVTAPIEGLPIDRRTLEALQAKGIHTGGDLTQIRASDLRPLHKASIEKLRRLLGRAGLDFIPEPSSDAPWTPIVAPTPIARPSYHFVDAVEAEELVRARGVLTRKRQCTLMLQEALEKRSSDQTICVEREPGVKLKTQTERYKKLVRALGLQLKVQPAGMEGIMISPLTEEDLQLRAVYRERLHQVRQRAKRATPTADTPTPRPAATGDPARQHVYQEAFSWGVPEVEIRHVLEHHRDLAKCRTILWRARHPNTPEPGPEVA
jgi:hypothetical protein